MQPNSSELEPLYFLHVRFLLLLLFEYIFLVFFISRSDRKYHAILDRLQLGDWTQFQTQGYKNPNQTKETRE